MARARLPVVVAPGLARRLGHKEFATLPIPKELADELTLIWPPGVAR